MTECPDCGARNSERSAFCIRCGRPFSLAASAETEPPTNVPPANEAGALVDDASELYAAGQLDDAVAACHAALNMDPDLVPARSLLGMIEEERGNLAQALAEYEAVIRLAPARTAERERAERLRAKVIGTAAPTLVEDDDERRRRMLVPAVAALGVIIIVLSVAIFWPRGHRDPRPGDAPAGMLGAMPAPGTMPEMGQTAPPSAQGPETAPGGFVFGEVGDNPLPATPIGDATTDDQTAAQPNSRSGQRTHTSTTGVQSPPAKTWMPPPTIKDEGNQLLKVPGAEGPPPVLPSPVRPPETVTHQTTAPQQRETTPATTRRPRSEIRIEVTGDHTRPSAPTTEASQAHSAEAAPSSAPSAGIPRTAPSSSGSSGVLPRTSNGGTPATSGGTPAPARRSVPVSPDRSRIQPPTRSGTSSGDSTSRSQPIRMQGGGTGATSLRAAGGRGTQQPTRVASTGHSGSSADQSRARAQAEWQKGNPAQAKRMFQEAIRGYQEEGRQNPERAAASRSAVQSCQRAIDAVDAGQ